MKKIPFKGRSKLALMIGASKTRQWMWVADIQDECILGMDFLRSHGCLVNLLNDTLVSDDVEIPLLD